MRNALFWFLVLVSAVYARDPEKRVSERVTNYELFSTSVNESDTIYVRDATTVTIRVSLSALSEPLTATVIVKGKLPPPYDDTGYQPLDVATANATETYNQEIIASYNVDVSGYERIRVDALTDTGNASGTIDVVVH